MDFRSWIFRGRLQTIILRLLCTSRKGRNTSKCQRFYFLLRKVLNHAISERRFYLYAFGVPNTKFVLKIKRTKTCKVILYNANEELVIKIYAILIDCVDDVVISLLLCLQGRYSSIKLYQQYHHNERMKSTGPFGFDNLNVRDSNSKGTLVG